MITITENDYIPAPLSEAEITKAIQEQVNRECLDYLKLTDWYVTRLVEATTPIPPEVLVKRAECRLRIV